MNNISDLLFSVADQANEHLAEIETDLLQMSLLLDETFEKLNSGFLALHQEISNQKQALKQCGVIDSALDVLQEYEQKIDKEVNQIVINLQFHDLASQLSGRAIERVSALKLIMEMLSVNQKMNDEANSYEQMNAFLQVMNSRWANHKAQPTTGAGACVKQKNMNAGEIELF